ncbi:MAG: GTPase [Pseudobdellovibrionaceae bacterium]
MRLKSFYAKTMTEAMQMVRDSLGEDAIIVATREENGGKSVRVTAAIDDAFHPSASSRRSGDSARGDLSFELGKEGRVADDFDWLQYDDEQEQDSSLTEAIIDSLLRHAAPEDVMDQIVGCASMMDVDEPTVAFVGALDTLFNFTPLPTKAYKKALMFVGQPGSGKTLATAKMATRAVMNGLDVAIITADTLRAGATEQLKAFTKLLKIELHVAKTPMDLKKILQDLGDKDQILIDSPGINPFKTEDMKLLASFLAAGDIEAVMVLPAAGDATESGEIARVFSALGVRRFVATRLDMARRLGGLLAAAQHGGMSFSDACTSSAVAEGLEPLSPRRLGNYFFPGHDKAGTPRATDSLRTSSSKPSSRKKSTG